MAVWVSLALFTFIVGQGGGLPVFFRGRPRGGMVGSPRQHQSWTLPPDMWIEQRLDHFNSADARTWKQRYFVNDTFFESSGPVLLMIGGEGTANPTWMVMGQWIKWAQEFNGLCLLLEHRFYGKSHPTEDLSTENLQYLSSEQGLADLAYFRTQMAQRYNVTDNKWIAIGGSYPGSLAGWIRLKYPHLIYASIATSAPVFAKLNFEEYLGVVRDSLATTGPQCNQNIQLAVAALNKLMTTKQGRQTIKTLFMLCDSLENASANDIANMYSILAGNFEGVVQYNKDNREFEGAVGTNLTIELLCSMMTSTDKTPVENYAAVNQLLLKTYSQQCLDYNYKSMISELQGTSWSSSASEGGRQWTYQTCTEFGWYQSSDLQLQPFGHMFPVNFSIQQCTDIFGSQFTQRLITEGINRTNTNYGGYNLKVKRVIFPNGSIDPWHAMGLKNGNTSQEVYIVYIKGTAHCADMYPDSPDDMPELKKARNLIKTQIGKWLQT